MEYVVPSETGEESHAIIVSGTACFGPNGDTYEGEFTNGIIDDYNVEQDDGVRFREGHCYE